MGESHWLYKQWLRAELEGGSTTSSLGVPALTGFSSLISHLAGTAQHQREVIITHRKISPPGHPTPVGKKSWQPLAYHDLEIPEGS